MPAKQKTAKKVTPREFRFTFTVVGIKFRMDKDKRATLAKACPVRGVTLVREQENKYDPNAIMVKWNPPSWHDKAHLGYLSADAAAILAPHMDDYVATAKADGEEKTGLQFKSATLVGLVGPDNLTGYVDAVFLDWRPAKEEKPAK